MQNGYILPDVIPPDQEEKLNTLLTAMQAHARSISKDISYLTVVKMKGWSRVIMDVDGDDAEREALMGFFITWAITKSNNDLRAQIKRIMEQ